MPASNENDHLRLADTLNVPAGPRPVPRPFRPTPPCGSDGVISYGRYRVTERIGQGAMGTVYLALDPDLGRQVAVKVHHFDPEDALARQLFQREARAHASIRHPNVCPIHDVGEEGGRPYVVMDYISGDTLEVLLQQMGRFEDCAEAARLGVKIAHALGTIHAKGVIHRDLKPANILIDLDGQPVVTDFGVAHCQNDPTRLTAEGRLIGTPSYVSPEQARGDLANVDGRTDLYSLGVVLFRMLTGRLPHEGNLTAVLTKLQTQPAAHVSRYRPGLDTSLAAAVMKALEPSPAGRFSSAEEFARVLSAWLEGQFLPQPVPPISRPKARRWPPWVGLVMCLALLKGR